jgi:FkbM family methyltransferase
MGSTDPDRFRSSDLIKADIEEGPQILKLHGPDFEYSNFADQQRLLAGRDVRAIVDAGANVGNTVAVYMDLFPKAQVYAFEPYPPTHQVLKERFQDNPQLHAFKLALGARCEEGSLQTNEYDDTNSLLRRPEGGRRYWAADNIPCDSVPVDIISLDEFSRHHVLEHIDILKLDIQGGEGQALKGAQNLLLHQRIDLIFTEVFFVPHYEGALLFHALTTLLSGFGYSLYNMTHFVHGRNGQLRFGDALYVSSKIRDAVIDAYPQEG